MSRRYSQKEDDKILAFVDEHGYDTDIENLAKELGRTPASVNERIRRLRNKNQIADFSEEECKLLMGLVKHYTDSDKAIQWAQIADNYFYKPRREPSVLRRKYYQLKKEEEKDLTLVSSSSSSSSASTSDTEVEEIINSDHSSEAEDKVPSVHNSDHNEDEDNGLPKPDLDGLDPFSDNFLQSSDHEEPQTHAQTAPTFGAFAQARPINWGWGWQQKVQSWQSPDKSNTLVTMKIFNEAGGDNPKFSYCKAKNIKQPHVLLVLPETDE